MGEDNEAPEYLMSICLQVYTFVVAASLSSTYSSVRPGTRVRVGLLAAASVSA